MGRYRSIQSIMLAEALKGITDNQTITAYLKCLIKFSQKRFCDISGYLYQIFAKILELKQMNSRTAL